MKNKFEELIRENAFLEYANVFKTSDGKTANTCSSPPPEGKSNAIPRRLYELKQGPLGGHQQPINALQRYPITTHTIGPGHNACC